MSFRLWLERRFIQLAPEVQQQIEKIISNINPNAPNGAMLGSVYMKNVNLGKFGKNISGTIPVYVDNTITSAGSYNLITGKISLHPRILHNPDTVRQILQHEITHATDPANAMDVVQRAQYRQMAPNTKSTKYFQSRPEFNAYGTQIANAISNSLSKMNATDKQKTINILYQWLRSKNKIDFLHNLQNWLKGNLLMNDAVFRSTLAAWQKDPRLWMQFKQKLFNLLSANH